METYLDMETIKAVLTFDFTTLLGVLAALLSTGVLWYYWYVYRPYAKFPSYRVDLRLPFWMLKGKNINSVVTHKLIDVSKRYESEGMFVMWAGIPQLIVFGEEIVKLIVNDPDTINKPKAYELMEVVLGKGLLTSNGETWKKQRKLINPAFYPLALKEHMSVFNGNAADLVKQLSETKGQTTEEIIEILSECSLQTVGESTLGKKFVKGDRRLVEIVQMAAEFMVYRFFCPWLYFDFMIPLFPYGRHILKILKEGFDITEQTIEEEEKLLRARPMPSEPVKIDEDANFYGRKPKTFTNILLEQHMKDPSFSLKEIRDQIVILTSAAYDTTAHALMWCLFLLGLHQDVQERAYEEVMAETEGDIQYTDLPNLTYLECVLKETLRIYPAAPAYARSLSKDVQYGKYFIPKNTSVVIFPYMVHRNPEIYPDPEKFDPERFMAKDSKIMSWHFIPFAEGSRSCIGKNFALMEMKIFLAHILRNFKVISLDRREDIQFFWAVVLCSLKKLRMQFVPRH